MTSRINCSGGIRVDKSASASQNLHVLGMENINALDI